MKIKQINNNLLKIIAVICMIIDHIHVIFNINNILLIMIGRLSFPIFAYLISEGIKYTSNKKKYARNLLIFALISEVPFNLAFSNKIIDYENINTIWSFFIAVIVITFLDYLLKKDKKGCLLYFPLIIFLVFLISTLISVDYLGFGVLLIICFYYSNKTKYKNLIDSLCIIIFSICICIISKSFIQMYCILSIFLILLYSHKKEKRNNYIKYGFYIFYPLHLLVLYLISFYF